MSFFRDFFRKPANELRGFLLVIFLFLALVLFFFYRFLDGSVVFAFKDLSRYFYPLRFLMVEQVKAGLLPLWNPYIFCGFPLLATLQACFFYPLTVIYYILPFNLAFNYYIILHYFLAACFTYALLRHYRLGRAAAFFGGVVFAFSGYLLSVSNMNTSLSSVIWLPLVLLFFDRQRFIALSVTLALMFLGGEPTIIYITVLFLLCYGLVFAKQRGKSVLLLLAACLLAVGLTAVQLIPFIELSRLSDRVVQTDFRITSLRSFPPRELISFILPYFFGNPGQFGSYTETLLGEANQNWLITPYLGIIPLIMVFFSFARKRSGFFGAAALLALFLALGKYTFVYHLAYWLLPGVSLIRYPVKFLFLTTFCLSLLAAFGFEELLARLDGQKEKIGRAALVIFILLAVLIVLSINVYYFSPALLTYLAHKYSSDIPNYFIRLLGEIVNFNLHSLLNLTALIAAFLVLTVAAYCRKVSRPVMVGGIILLTVADLFANGVSVTVGAPAGIFTLKTENYKIMLKDRAPYRFFYTSKVGEDNMMIYGENYTAALVNAKDNLCDNWHIPHHQYDLFGYESVKPLKLMAMMHRQLSEESYMKNLDLLSAGNVKYILSLSKISDPRLKLLRHKRAYGTDNYFYENLAVMPRTYFLGDRGGKAGIVSYRPGRIVIATDSRRAGTLFLSEAFFPGWKASVDDKETKITKAKEIFQTVAVPAGKHKVSFVYDPWTFKLGAVISIVCLLFLGYWSLRGWGGQRELNP